MKPGAGSGEFGDFVADCVALITDEPGVNRKERKARTYAETGRGLW